MNTSSEPQAFGAGRTGSAFDPIEFVKKPQVILRIVAWVCHAIILNNKPLSFIGLRDNCLCINCPRRLY